ncbi:Bug family tripartite tricarboxylate transporter substrate binding protein [Roseinatronobacter monicus]|uniref:Tripartite-type tricarboxylate transporter receptor subunit TctC n=1 Tax=Roseinatronobacter monicus TaxID=393481 RepID=A0A543KIA7_9RHOB|nr:tripartite tricarboxylate transporter substrate binding protein [Roseinatronobacter monicus]TQM94804.1 tripartite-type tricarboxylate transporter receptor subunit TctC [Roseinatronobacter monicus]
MKTTLIALGMGVSAAALAAPVAAEYPTRTIQMIIPFGPGGATDLSARALSTPLSQIVPQSIVLTNRAGAGGATGSVAVRDAEGDGYTLLLARVGSHTVNPAMNPNLPYTLDEFRFVGIYEINPVACVVNSNSDFHSIDDLIDAVNDRPGEILFSSSGVGSLPHFGALMVLDAFDVSDLDENVIHIPTEGDGQALTAVLQGTSDFYCGSTSPAAPFINSGQMRPLMVTSAERLDGFDAPTVEEIGKPELAALVGWTGLAGPASLTDEATEKWGEWLAEATQDEDFQRFMTSGGSIVQVMSPDETVEFVNSAYESFRRLVVELDLEID